MPIYRMRCKSCDSEADWWTPLPLGSAELEALAEVERVELGVPVCCQLAMVKHPVQASKVHQWPAEGVHLEHAGEHGKTFYSKKELQNWCKEKGVSSGALL